MSLSHAAAACRYNPTQSARLFSRTLGTTNSTGRSGMPLFTALSLRHSTREYCDRPLSISRASQATLRGCVAQSCIIYETVNDRPRARRYYFLDLASVTAHITLGEPLWPHEQRPPAGNS